MMGAIRNALEVAEMACREADDLDHWGDYFGDLVRHLYEPR